MFRFCVRYAGRGCCGRIALRARDDSMMACSPRRHCGARRCAWTPTGTCGRQRTAEQAVPPRNVIALLHLVDVARGGREGLHGRRLRPTISGTGMVTGREAVVAVDGAC